MTSLLVIDDNPDYRALVRMVVEQDRTLRFAGEAADAADGIRAAEELQPDIILLDILLPGMDGLAAVPLLREAAPSAAIIAVSAYPEHQLWGRSPAASTVPYISKIMPIGKLPAELVRLAQVSDTTRHWVITARHRFPAELTSAREARRYVRSTLETWQCRDLIDSVELLVSELVTNAVIHARSDVELLVALGDDRLRVEVIDSTDAYIQRRDASDESQSGRGMALIESLAIAWGIDTLLAGKAVWFEVARTDVGSWS